MFAKWIPRAQPQPRPPDTLFSLRHVANALGILVTCCVDTATPNYLSIRYSHSRNKFACICTIEVTNRNPDSLIISMIVRTDSTIVINLPGLRIPVNAEVEDIAVATIVSLFYRRVGLLDPATDRARVLCTGVTWYVSSEWSPVRLARFSAILYTQTYGTDKMGLVCRPIGVDCVELQFGTTGTKLQLDYKGSSLKVSKDARVYHIEFPGGLRLETTTTTFKWVHMNDPSLVSTLCQLLWHRLVLIN